MSNSTHRDSVRLRAATSVPYLHLGETQRSRPDIKLARRPLCAAQRWNRRKRPPPIHSPTTTRPPDRLIATWPKARPDFSRAARADLRRRGDPVMPR